VVVNTVNVVFCYHLFHALNARAKTKNRDQMSDNSYSRRVQKKLARRRGEFLLEVGLHVLYSALSYFVFLLPLIMKSITVELSSLWLHFQYS